MSDRPSPPARSVWLPRKLVIAINSTLLAICLYLGASLLVLSNARTLMGYSMPFTYTALGVLFTPYNYLWYYFSSPGFSSEAESKASTPAPKASSTPPPETPPVETRAADMSASRQLDDTQRNRMRDEIAIARQAYDRLIASGRPREAAVALSPGIAAASRLDDLDSLETLVDLQVDALKGTSQ